jgi:hypothetical protein
MADAEWGAERYAIRDERRGSTKISILTIQDLQGSKALVCVESQPFRIADFG